MPRIAFATSSKIPNLAADDRLLLAPLQERGIEAEPVIWDDPACDWSAFDAVILRSCWDYHLKADAFLNWLSFLEQAKIPLWNPASLVRWSANKSYLRGLDGKGVSIVPTFWPQPGEKVRLHEKLNALGWSKAVIKPLISATAYRTYLVTADDANSAQAQFEDLQSGPGVMVQKFMDTIIDEGEWSLIFFDGEFSHAILKTPKPGDFRVQNDFGGSERPADPPAHVLHSATGIVQTVAPTLYARVDGLVDGNQFRLMELELIEPMLFLSSHPQAPARFSDSIARKL
jgi:hypothetical protein